jgi:hypothetical protein
LDDDYFYYPKLRVKTTNESDLSWIAEGELTTRGVHASMSAIRKGTSLSLDKIRVKSDGRVLAEASLKTSDITKFSVSAEDGRQEPGKPLQSFGKLGCEIKFPNLSLTGDVDVVNGPILRSSFLYNYGRSLSIGAETMVNTHLEEKGQGPEVIDMNVGIVYTGPSWSLSAKTAESLGSLQVSYFHSSSPKLTIGSQLDYRLKSNSQRLQIGAKYL